ncbi:MAG: hypothetical protein HQL27_02590 [Candidatus Omnitrophica bacterium]|nr:hypothetical protein [Candidatus Omnitrophota bacterium]
MNRVVQLADRKDWNCKKDRAEYSSIIPLNEILSDINKTGDKSKKEAQAYFGVLNKLGPEPKILLDTPLEVIRLKCEDLLTEAIRRMRKREVLISEGYDGEYGSVNVFNPGEIEAIGFGNFITGQSIVNSSNIKPYLSIDFDVARFKELLAAKKAVSIALDG